MCRKAFAGWCAGQLPDIWCTCSSQCCIESIFILWDRCTQVWKMRLLSEIAVAVDNRQNLYHLCALNLGDSKTAAFKFSMFVSYTWWCFANSCVLCFPLMCICCSTRSEKTDKVVKVIKKLQNTNMENYFKPFWKIVFHLMFLSCLLRSSLCRDTSLEELMGLRNLFSLSTFQGLI